MEEKLWWYKYRRRFVVVKIHKNQSILHVFIKVYLYLMKKVIGNNGGNGL